jgi:hypothetical protein
MSDGDKSTRGKKLPINKKGIIIQSKSYKDVYGVTPALNEYQESLQVLKQGTSM